MNRWCILQRMFSQILRHRGVSSPTTIISGRVGGRDCSVAVTRRGFIAVVVHDSGRRGELVARKHDVMVDGFFRRVANGWRLARWIPLLMNDAFVFVSSLSNDACVPADLARGHVCGPLAVLDVLSGSRGG